MKHNLEIEEHEAIITNFLLDDELMHLTAALSLNAK